MDVVAAFSLSNRSVFVRILQWSNRVVRVTLAPNSTHWPSYIEVAWVRIEGFGFFFGPALIGGSARALYEPKTGKRPEFSRFVLISGIC
jgi:hypothetical protein